MPLVASSRTPHEYASPTNWLVRVLLGVVLGSREGGGSEGRRSKGHEGLLEEGASAEGSLVCVDRLEGMDLLLLGSGRDGGLGRLKAKGGVHIPFRH